MFAKENTKKSIFLSIVILAIIGSLPIMLHESFAQESTEIIIPQDIDGTCPQTNSCFISSVIIVEPGTVVIWTNQDNLKHSIVSGSPITGPDGVFKSDLILTGESFSYTFEDEGEYPYYSPNDIRRKGLVIVSSNPQTVSIPEEKPEIVIDDTSGREMTKQDGGFSSDASIMVELTTSDPIPQESMSLHLKFVDAQSGTLSQNVNYDIVVIQNGNQVLSDMNVYDKDGSNSHDTIPLDSFVSVDVEITILGFGLPGDESNWAGPKGDVITFVDVPEFGTIAMMILALSVGSLMILFTKTKKLMKSNSNIN